MGLMAAVALAALDWLILVAFFYARSSGTEFVPIAMVIGVLAAIWLRQRWLLFVVQSIVTLLMLISLVELGADLKAVDVISAVGLSALGYALAWLVARAISLRPAKPST